VHAYISYYLFGYLVCIWNLLGRSFSILKLIACDCCKFLGRTEQEYTRLVVKDRNTCLCSVAAARTVCTEADCTATGEFPAFVYCCCI
jgi:hypothetical protein